MGSKSSTPFPTHPNRLGVAERKNRALKEMTTYMLEAKGLAANIWAEAKNISAYIQNRVPHSSMKGKTPFEAYFGHKPDVSNFRVFWVHCLGSNSTRQEEVFATTEH